MKCQPILWEQIRKNIVSLSAKFIQRGVKVDTVCTKVSLASEDNMFCSLILYCSW